MVRRILTCAVLLLAFAPAAADARERITTTQATEAIAEWVSDREPGRVLVDACIRQARHVVRCLWVAETNGGDDLVADEARARRTHRGSIIVEPWPPPLAWR